MASPYRLVDGGWCGVHAVFVDGRQDFADDCKLLRAFKGVHWADTLHVFIEAGGNIPSVGDSKSITHVLEDKEWFSLFVCHDADVVAGVVEDGDVVHQLLSFIELLLGWRFMDA